MSTDKPVPTDRDALVADIEATRDRLASTADALAAKADVKGQAQAKVADVKEQVGTKAHDASASAPGTPAQQSGVLLGAIVAATALAVWLIVRRKS